MRWVALLAVMFSHIIIPSNYDYDIHMSIKGGSYPTECKSSMTINQEERTCWCGRPPVIVVFYYGEIECLCRHHLIDLCSYAFNNQYEQEDIYSDLGMLGE